MKITLGQLRQAISSEVKKLHEAAIEGGSRVILADHLRKLAKELDDGKSLNRIFVSAVVEELWNVANNPRG